MENKIHEYIESAFGGVGATAKVNELKTELYVNLAEKYQDELAKGTPPQEAYNCVISGLGDLSELVESVKEPSPLQGG